MNCRHGVKNCGRIGWGEERMLGGAFGGEINYFLQGAWRRRPICDLLPARMKTHARDGR